MGDAKAQSMSLSRGDGVKNISFQHSKLDWVNFHEGKIGIVRFDDSAITRTIILRASMDELHCDRIKTEKIFFSQEHYKNRIGTLDFGEMKGVGSVELDPFTNPETVQRFGRFPNFGTMRFGQDGKK
jgi:hypothetical protein